METVQPYLIPLRVSDESIKEQVKVYYPRDYRRMRTYVVNVDRSDVRIKGLLVGLEEEARNKFVQVKERILGCDTMRCDVNDEVEDVPVWRKIPKYKYDDLLKLADKNVKIGRRKKLTKVQREIKISEFDKKAEVGAQSARINGGLVYFTCRTCQVYFLASSCFSAGRLNTIASCLSTLEKFNNLFHCPKCNIKKLNHYFF